MDVGSMRNLVDLESPVHSADSLGQRTTRWQSLGQAWCEIKYVAADEMVWAGGQIGVATTKFCMRYFTGLTRDCRIRYQGRVFDIVFIDDVDGRGVEHQVRCKEKS